MPVLSFVILNQCIEGRNLLRLSDSNVALFRDTMEEFATVISQFHGGVSAIRIGKNENDRKPGESAVHLTDKTPEAPQAVAYHQTVNGIPDIVIGMDNVDGISQGSDSLTCAGTHELGETIVDPGANQWAEIVSTTARVRKLRAKEACDRVQNLTWQASTGADCSDFLLQAAFIPGANGPWDYVSLVTGKQMMADQNDASNGYDVEATISDETQLMQKHAHGVGNLSKLALARKQGCFSRTNRRGVILVAA